MKNMTALMTLALMVTACGPQVKNVQAPPSDLQAGPMTITGEVAYTNSFFPLGVAEPIVILEDQGGFVRRDRSFVIPVQSQVLGEITSDFSQSPFSYSLSLPAKPNGTLNDVDHDGQVDEGVMVFAVAYWTNTWGDPYLERRDQGGGGWSTAYASTKVSQRSDSYLEVYGGKYLVYAPDDAQQFPSDFGADKKLFTDDDPLMSLPPGWSEIDLDKHPFTIDRSESLKIDLIEGEGAEQDDFSNLSYTKAFDAMLDKFRKEYAFTELKQIDWDERKADFRPKFEAAEKQRDAHAYELALRDFLWSIPDTHVGMNWSKLVNDFVREQGGGIGLELAETDEGMIVVGHVTAGGSAETAGIRLGAQIVSIEGKPIGDVVAATVPWSSPFSNPVLERLEQLRYAVRFSPELDTVEIEFRNPDEAVQRASVKVVYDVDTFDVFPASETASPTSLPVEFQVLQDGVGYIKVSSFLDNDVLSIQVWERAIRYFNDNTVRNVVLDMRGNPGGSGWLADQMAAYFFGKETLVGKTARYDKSTGGFYLDPGEEAIMIPPPEDLQYTGRVAVLVGPACASACEFFSYDMTIDNRALIVGQYPSEGAGGSVEAFYMPEGIYCQLTTGRAMDATGKIHIEGRGVVPTVKVPVSLDTIQRAANGEDVVLQAAVQALTQ